MVLFTSSGARLDVGAASTTSWLCDFGKVISSFCPLVSSSVKWGSNSIRINELQHINCKEQCLACSKYSICAGD